MLNKFLFLFEILRGHFSTRWLSRSKKTNIYNPLFFLKKKYISKILFLFFMARSKMRQPGSRVASSKTEFWEAFYCPISRFKMQHGKSFFFYVKHWLVSNFLVLVSCKSVYYFFSIIFTRCFSIFFITYTYSLVINYAE